MLLLDVILEPHRMPDTTRIPRPIIRDTVSAPVDTTDSVISSVDVFGNNQQLADIAPLPSEAFGSDGNFYTLLLSVLAVLAALSLCFYFVMRYRKMKK